MKHSWQAHWATLAYRENVSGMGRYILATDLSHDGHQRHGSDVGALPAHVATCDDLESRLLRGVDVVRNKPVLHDLLFDRMSSSFNS
jgi:hypothetical protein